MITFKTRTTPPKLNIALWGPSGAGKTYTGLGLAHALGSRVCVVDTEHQASSLYTARFPADIAEFLPPFQPAQFIDAIQSAEQAGYDVLLIDSLSPEWDGPGGCLDMVAQLRTQGKKPHQAWGVVTPQHDALLGAINRTPLSVIVTLREKPRLQMSGGTTALSAPEPIMRDRFEYEYDLVLHIDARHHITAIKSRLFGVPEGKSCAADSVLLSHIRQVLKSDDVPVPAEVGG